MIRYLVIGIVVILTVVVVGYALALWLMSGDGMR